MKEMWKKLTILPFMVLGTSTQVLANKGKVIDPLVVGVILPTSGSQSAFGKEALESINLAMEDLKKSSPELAASIQLINVDTKSRPSQAAKHAEKLINVDRASILIGGLTVSSSINIAKVALRLKKPYFSPAIHNANLCNLGPQVFCGGASKAWLASIMGGFLKSSLKVKKAAIVGSMRTPSSAESAVGFETAFSGPGTEIVYNGMKEVDKISFRGSLNKAIKAGAKALFLTSDRKKVLSHLKQIRLVAPNLIILGREFWYNPKLLAKAYKKSLFFPVEFTYQIPTPKVGAFVDRFKKNVKRYPSDMAGLVYDAFTTIAIAYRNAKSSRATPLLASLNKIKGIDGIIGPMSITSKRFLEKPVVILNALAGGKSSFVGVFHPKFGLVNFKPTANAPKKK